MITPTLVDLLDAGLKATLVLATAALLTRLLRPASAALRHLVWTLALGVALLVPFLRPVAPRFEWPLLPATTLAEAPRTERDRSATMGPTGHEAVQVLDVRQPAPPSNPAIMPPLAQTEPAAPPPLLRLPLTDPPAPQGIGSITFLLWLWLAGVLAVSAPLLAGAVRMSWLRRTTKPIEDPAWTALNEDVAAELGLRRAVRLVEGPTGSMPMAWGVWRPVVLLPQEAASWPQAERRAVLTHELAHVRRHDCLTQALAHAACALYWFHPLAWMAARRMRVERELACDDLVLRSGASGPDYADQLLHLARSARASNQPSWAAVAMARPSQLEGRLLALLDTGLDRRGLSRRRVFALWAASALLGTGLAGLHLWTTPAQAARPLEVTLSETAQDKRPPALGTRGEWPPATRAASAAAARSSAPGAVASTATSQEQEAPDPPEPPGRFHGGHESDDDGEDARATPPSPAVVAALGEALKDTDADVRKEALQSLAHLHVASAAPALARALEDADPEVRQQAAFALGELRAKEAALPLRRILATDANAEVRQQAAFALGQMRDAGAVPALSAAVKDHSAEVRQQAVFALGQLRAGEAVGALLAALEDAEAEVRQQAAFALGQIRSREAVPALLDLLKDPDAEVRQQAVFALGQLRDARASDALVAALKDKSAEVRRQAAFALGQLED